MKLSDQVPLGETITKLEAARDASFGGSEARRLYDAAIATLKDPKYSIAETETQLKNAIEVELTHGDADTGNCALAALRAFGESNEAWNAQMDRRDNKDAKLAAEKLGDIARKLSRVEDDYEIDDRDIAGWLGEARRLLDDYEKFVLPKGEAKAKS